MFVIRLLLSCRISRSEASAVVAYGCRKKEVSMRKHHVKNAKTVTFQLTAVVGTTNRETNSDESTRNPLTTVCEMVAVTRQRREQNHELGLQIKMKTEKMLQVKMINNME